MKANHIIATLTILLSFGILYAIIFSGLGGNEAVFSILGYLAGWISSIILFYFRKKPDEK